MTFYKFFHDALFWEFILQNQFCNKENKNTLMIFLITTNEKHYFFEGPNPHISHNHLLASLWSLQNISMISYCGCQKKSIPEEKNRVFLFWIFKNLLSLPPFFFFPVTRSHRTWLCITFPIWKRLAILLVLAIYYYLGGWCECTL